MIKKPLKDLKKPQFTPRSFIFINQVITKKNLEEILSWMFRNYGLKKTCLLAELLKESGFQYATQSGISLNIEDLKVPYSKKELMKITQSKLDSSEKLYKRGELTSGEWFQKQVFEWNTTSELLKEEIVNFFEKTDPLNPLYMMSFSGARGNLSQVRQLIGMRGLMSDQKGEMIGSAIQKNFREGLTVIDFLISSYGARKGLVDTAIRTADSGYLTRRLVDIAQDVIIRQFDCQTLQGVLLIRPQNKKGSFSERLIGRVLSKPIIQTSNNKIIAHRGQEITFSLAKKIEELKIGYLSIRSPLCCNSYRSVCQTCFGWDFTNHRLVELGEAIGIIAAQSIGEPGTQLTMRTFHTGGVFSRELSQQVRSEFSGQVYFASNLKTQFIRTNQGDYRQVLQTTSFFEIKTYRNETVRVQIEKDDLLMIRDQEFLKKGQPILQLASQLDDSDVEIQKTLATKFDGEIFYQPREKYNFFEYNMIIWVLAAKAITLANESKFVLNSLVNTSEQSFGKTKLVIKSNSFSENIQVIDKNNLGVTFTFYGFNNIFLFRIKNTNNLLLKLRSDQFILNNELNFNKQNNSKILQYLGRSTTFYNLSKTPGLLFNLNLLIGPSNFQKLKRINTREIKSGGLAVLIPQENYNSIKTSYINLDNNRFSFIKKYSWLTSNIQASISGLIQSTKENSKSSNISIKPGAIYTFLRKNINVKKFYEFFEKKFFFPGDYIFKTLKINNIVYTQLFISKSKLILLIQPIAIYSIASPQIYRKFGQNSHIFSDEAQIVTQRFFISKQKELFLNTPIKNTIETKLFIKNFYPTKSKISQLLIKINKTKYNKWVLQLGRSYLIELNDLLPRAIRTQNSTVLSLVKKKQVLEPYTIISHFQISSEASDKIYKIGNHYSERYQSQEVRIVNKDHVRGIYCEEKLPTDLNSEFIFSGDIISNGLISTKSGKYLCRKGSLIQFRIGQPYLFTEGAKVYKNNGDFAPENSVLGYVTYRIFKSQDIIQGLPKVEEILEARSHANPSVLVHQSGIVKKITNYSIQNNVIEVLAFDKSSKSIKEFSYSLIENDSQTIDVEVYDFANFTKPLQKGVSDPQQVLDIYFQYFNRRDSHHKAILRSLNKIASLFVKSIQSVYQSQGIQILDRHLEVIVRQMITKAKIEYPGTTPLVTGEYLDLFQIELLNEMLRKNSKPLIYYKPALLGLTKAALTTESFISAASFQETVRILTQAAIDGKVDWLRGLKERVVVGGLIPCGTGVLTFLDHWLVTNVFFFGRSTISLATRRRILRDRFKTQKTNLKEIESNTNFIKQKGLISPKKSKKQKEQNRSVNLNRGS